MIVPILAVPVAYIAGAFTPSIGRKIKALFVKETTTVKTAVVADVKNVAAVIKGKL